MERVDCAVIGAGVVGLAVARELALAGREVVMLEAAEAIGSITSSRNSEVVHAGIYYPTGSLKARLCVRGRRLLYDFARDRGIRHWRCGKLIVACEPAEIAVLERLMATAQANGVEEMRWLEAAEARALEPQLACVKALLSPVTGVLDSHAYMLQLQGEAEDRGMAVAFHSPVESGEVRNSGLALRVGGREPITLLARSVVNSAGFDAQLVGRGIAGLPPASVPPRHLAKGNYYTLQGRAPFSRLIYPAPEKAGLGVHITIDLGGQARFGPDVEWIERVDYDVDPGRAALFYAAIRRYWPGLKDGQLQPGYAGIRPKIQGPTEAAKDFVIQGPRDHGVPGLVNLYGIESPGLTASLAIAEQVREILQAA
ncbi:MAG: NAD(P)/FAD-dependent oxidoreductase [Alphaproteobacteria bacterium]|nr:NAD(P)/FAD-dependent oxidoreductase [Alphaproteobacteria bacterium]